MFTSRAFAIAIIVTTLLLGPLLLRTVYSCNKFFYLAERQFHSGELEQAIESYQRAGSWWLPFSSLSDQSVERLLTISQDDQLELQQRIKALRAAESALASSRSFLSGLFSARQALQTRVRQSLISFVPENAGTVKEAVQFEPVYGGQLLAAFSFMLFLLAVTSIIWSSFSASGNLRPEISRISLGVGLLSYFAWILGLWLA